MLMALSAACGSGTATQNPASEQQGPSVLSADRLSVATGWVLTDGALSMTSDSGTTWVDITPEGLRPSTIKGVFFLNPDYGWLIAPEKESGSLLAYRTEDGGKNWETAPLGTSDADSYGAASYVSFADTKNGWAVVKLVTGPNFSRGDLYRTTDGGISWTKLPIPIGDPIVFSSPSDGFAAGGPAGDQLFVTRDGGVTWEAQTVVPPTPFAASYPVYALPSYIEGGAAVLPVTFTGAASGMAFYRSNDGGRTWSLQHSFPSLQALSTGTRMASDITESGGWVAAAPNGGRIFRSTSTQEVEEVAPNGLLPGVVDIDFADAKSGWAVVHEGRCPAGLKDGCVIIQQLLATTDGGQTWAPLIPQ